MNITASAQTVLPDMYDPFAAAVAATRMPMIITDPHLDDNPIVYANDAFIRLTGYDRAELIGKNCRFLQGPGTNADDVARMRTAIARRESIEIDLLNYRKDGSSFWNRLLVSPVFNKQGKLTHFFASQFDVSPERNRVTELARTQDELELEIETRMHDIAATEARLRFVLGAAKMGTWTLDLASRRLTTSNRCRENFGRDPQEAFGYEDLRAAIHPDDVEEWEKQVSRAIADRSQFAVEYRIHTPAGAVWWIEVRGHVVTDDDGTATAMVGVSQDITPRKEAEEHRKVLTRELAHRVKNSLATAQAVFSHSLKNAASVEDARQKVSGRIQAMSAAQDMLTQDNWASADLRSVVETTLRPFGSYDIRIDGPRVVLDEKGVSALSLALYELATNSMKYGALGAAGGFVTVQWDVADGPERMMAFHWTEKGGPKVSPPTRRGFGSTIIEVLTASDMGGTANLCFDPDGLRFRLEAPLPTV